MLSVLFAGNKDEIAQDVNLALNTGVPDCNIKTTRSGKECLDIIKNGNGNDLVIVDMNFTDTPCFDLIEKICEDSDIPIVVLSRNDDIFALVTAFDSGANDYIVIPFNKRIFAAKIKALIRRREWDIQARNQLNITDKPKSIKG
ncbi:MAG: response regulator [Dehalococcoidales bacterium]|nr:response regulator [Dehalococcoidales bacterium]